MTLPYSRPNSRAETLDLRVVARRLAQHRSTDTARGVVELAITVAPFVVTWLLMWLVIDISYLLTLALAVPAAGFLLRLFLIQHDCGHGAFFRHRHANDWVGRCIGVLTLSPYDFWRRTHAMHHAGTGNLDKRGIGDVDTLTVAEYAALPWAGRARYWLYRHPLVLFGLGPAYLFFLRYRLPLGLAKEGWRPWLSTMGTNLGIVALSVGLILLVGWKTFLLIQLPVTLMAASAGVWLFYVQHQFEHTHWAPKQDWTYHEAAVFGSSHLVMPAVLRWFTANIGMHHLHHLCSTVPFYRLPAALKALPELAQVNRLTLLDSVRSARLVLWDERAKRLVSFREARAAA
ncbi:MAG: fatty acid desaturase [Sphingomonas bacterium]|uniref:fatty acid desaturase n=1 Tax=Sphingomonas bacterium TaxID=1895847 RepID=UPI00260B8618|nr:fatty acid desaturase [Sphingomonas bacterium]MDB5696294.1 fatty acid desaturase [Sphingomonas bacterium]